MTSDTKVNRILKTIEDQAKADRKEALKLLKGAKETLAEITTKIEISEKTGTQVADAYTSVFNSVILALKEAGVANERLIKLVTAIQKFKSLPGKGGDDEGKSLFASLKKSIGKDKDDD